MSTNHQKGVGCEVCLDKTIASRTYQGHAVCEDCVQGYARLFEAALESQTQYPVRWGQEILNPEHFVELLGEDFVRRYRRIERDYNAPFGHRIYCEHKLHPSDALSRGATIAPGTSKSLKSMATERYNGTEKDALVTCGHLVSWRNQRSGTQLTCYHCGGRLCACGQTLDVPNQSHECIQSRASDTPLEVELVRGRDFQRCPSCNTPIALRDGCNAMSCSNCDTEFCMICGAKALHDSGHWTRGAACPRWGQPNDATAMFDAEVEVLPEGFVLPANPNERAVVAEMIREGLARDWARLIRVAPEGGELRNLANARLRVLPLGVAIEDDQEFFDEVAADLVRATVRFTDTIRMLSIIAEVNAFVEAPENEARRDALQRLREIPRRLIDLAQSFRAGGFAYAGVDPANAATRMFLRQHNQVVRDLRLVREDAARGQLGGLRELYTDFVNELDDQMIGAVANLPN